MSVDVLLGLSFLQAQNVEHMDRIFSKADLLLVYCSAYIWLLVIAYLWT